MTKRVISNSLSFFSWVVAIALLLLLRTPSNAQSIPTTLGWFEIPNTKLRSVCAAENGFPQVWGAIGCRGITEAWSSAVFDTKRNRLLIWGGGHNDYYGNEVYALDLNNLTMSRVTNPGLPIATSACEEAIAGGTQPNSRHTYNLTDYMVNVDRMFVWGGSLACSTGTASHETWQFNPGSLTWQNMNRPLFPTASSEGSVAAYDPNSGKVFVWNHSDGFLYAYDPLVNSWKQLPNSYGSFDYHMTPVIDPVRKRLYVFGHNEQWMYDISQGNNGSSYPKQHANTTGGANFLVNDSPGLAYDPIQDRIIGWDGGNTVWLLNPGTGAWTSQTHSGGPAAVQWGTYGRFRYVPALNVFVTCNSVDANCYTLRLTSGGGTTPPPADTTPPSTPSNLIASAQSSSQIALSWTASSDNIGVTGYRVERCQGSGCTNFTLIANATSISHNDANLTANTVYSYRIRATDAAGNLSSYSAIASATTPGSAPPSTGSADTDFQARCSAPGVVKCVGFDNTTTDIVQNVNLWPAADGVFRGGLDTSVKASGTGSLRFTLPKLAMANLAGGWSPASNDALGRSFGQNSTFYLQFRQRFSPEMFSNYSNWDSAWKQIIIHRNQLTCASLELTTVHYYQSNPGWPTMYTDCGARGMNTNLSRTNWTSTLPLLMQQGSSDTDGYNCQYGNVFEGNGNGQGCFFYQANKWITFYYKISIGTWGQSNSRIEAWISIDGSPYRQWINVPNMRLDYDTALSDAYNNVTLTSYMTSLKVSGAATATTWYDEFIVSTQPIAVPGTPASTSPPNSPSNLALQ